MRSDKPQTKEFQDMVTKEILPSIRKTGAYVVGLPSLRETPQMDPLDILEAQGCPCWPTPPRRTVTYLHSLIDGLSYLSVTVMNQLTGHIPTRAHILRGSAIPWSMSRPSTRSSLPAPRAPP